MLEYSSYSVLQFLSNRRPRVRLNSKVIESVDVGSGMLQGSVLELLLFIFYTSELFLIVGNHMVGYA